MELPGPTTAQSEPEQLTETTQDHDLFQETQTQNTESMPWETANTTLDSGRSQSSSSKKAPSLLGTLGLLAVVAVGGWLFRRSSTDEQAYPDWQQVVAAESASTEQGREILVRRDSSGNKTHRATLELSPADLAATLTHNIRRALIRRDLVQANAELRDEADAQNPDPAITIEPPPDLETAPDLVKNIRDGRAKFFHLHLMDSCDEDGDVVQISINGQVYTTIGLTHAGATVSLPLTSGLTTLTVTGVRDGGGGITIRFSTSTGDYFSRPMHVGEDYHIGVSVP